MKKKKTREELLARDKVNKKINAEFDERVEMDRLAETDMEEWYKGNPSRDEVASYVSSYITNTLVPKITFFVTQATTKADYTSEYNKLLLIEKGICTEKEYNEGLAKFVAEKYDSVLAEHYGPLVDADDPDSHVVH